MKVSKNINGYTVEARPVFKGGAMPAYWAATVNDRSISRTFASARDAFHFVESHTAESEKGLGLGVGL